MVSWTKRIIKVLLLFLIIFNLSACLSLKIEVPEDPEAVVEYCLILKDINRDFSGTFKLTDDSISSAFESVYAVVKVKSVEQRHRIQWRWYGPGNKVRRESPDVSVNSDQKYLEYFVAWDRMSRDFFKEHCGRWTVVISLDDRFLIRKEFDILEQ